MAHLELSLFGGFHATLDGVLVDGFDTDKTRALLAYVAVEGTRPHERDALAGLLWPDLPDDAARRNLRHALFKLRQALGQADDGCGPLRSSAKTVQLDPAAGVALDVAAFTRLLTATRTHRHRHPARCGTCARHLAEAVALYRGELLAGFHLPGCEFFGEWLVLQRERLHRDAVDALERLTTYHAGRGEDGPALDYVFRHLELEPWREEAHAQAMILLARTGRRSVALAQYETCRRVLAAELQAEPSAATSALYEQLKAPGATLPDLPGPVFPHNLPPQLTPLIGRGAEARLLGERLDSLDYRLVTLVGPGGVGKTRLALHVADAQRGGFADGVYWISLAGLTPSATVAQGLATAIAQAVGFALHGAAEPAAQVLEALREMELLLVLDNFEHLLGPDPHAASAALGLLQAILQRGPRVSLLVTSRERLGVQAESLLDLTGLAFPDVTSSPALAPAPAGPPGDLEGYSAVQLFVERAQQADARFVLSTETAPSVAAICRLVAGLPLGIVLAAAWVRHFAPARIAGALQANLDFLTTTARDAAAPHSSLRAVFNHSWQLLAPVEQQVLRRLAVFRGGWDAESAAAIAGATLPTLLALVDKSLLRQEAAGRYSIHEVLRQYAAEQLDALPEERAAIRRRHAYYYGDIAEGAESGLKGEAQDGWLARLECEHDNMRAALDWARETGDSELGLRLGAALARFWYVRGYYSEGRARLAAILVGSSARAGDGARGRALRAKALQAAGDLARSQGDYAAAQGLCDESLALYRALGQPKDIAVALVRRAIVAWNQGDHALARRLYDESLGISRALGDKQDLAVALGNLGTMAFVDGDYAAARMLLEESCVLCRELGDTFNLAIRLNNLGNVALLQGEHAAARRWHREGLALRRDLGDQWGIAVSLIGLGGAAVGRGAPAHGTHLLGAAAALLEAIGATLEPDDRLPYEWAVAAARHGLARTEWEQAWAAGRALSVEEAVRLAGAE